MRAYTRGDWVHRQRVSSTFLTREKLSQKCSCAPEIKLIYSPTLYQELSHPVIQQHYVFSAVRDEKEDVLIRSTLFSVVWTQEGWTITLHTRKTPAAGEGGGRRGRGGGSGGQGGGGDKLLIHCDDCDHGHFLFLLMFERQRRSVIRPPFH